MNAPIGCSSTGSSSHAQQPRPAVVSEPHTEHSTRLRHSRHSTEPIPIAFSEPQQQRIGQIVEAAVDRVQTEHEQFIMTLRESHRRQVEHLRSLLQQSENRNAVLEGLVGRWFRPRDRHTEGVER
jgi:hypothetical protein